MTKSLDISSFLKVSNWLTEALELDELLPALIKSAIELLPSADAGSLFLYDETDNKLVIKAVYNYGQEVLGLRLGLEEGIAGWTFKTRQAVIIDDFFTDSRTLFFPGQKEIAPIKSMIEVPLCVKDKAIGVISFDNLSTTYAFNEEDLQVVQFFANNATIAIEHTRLYENLRKQNEELEFLYHKSQENARLRTEFLNCATHELRTPLCAIIGFAELLMNNKSDQLTDRHRQWFDIIYQSGQDMLRLINEILDLSALLAGVITLSPQPFSLKSSIDALVLFTKHLTKDKPIEISYSISPDLPTIYLDQTRLNQILSALLSNAAKFTQQGKITIEAKPVGNDRFSVSVSDTGIGIKLEHAELIFEEFGRVDNSSTRHYSGLGVGLSITKRLCQLMEGNISLQSVYNQGSTFTIELPIKLNSITVTN